MNPIERQILLNQIAIMEAMLPMAKPGAGSARELLERRYRETAQLVREKQGG